MRLAVLGGGGCLTAFSGRHGARRHALAHERRDDVDYVTVTAYVTEQDPSVTVYVDQSGHTLSVVTDPTVTATAQTTETKSAVAPPPVQTTTLSSAVAVAPVQPVVTPAAVATTKAVVAPAAPAPAASSQAVAGSTGSNSVTSNSNMFSGGVSDFKGIVYSPYKGNYGSTACKSAADVMKDFAAISASDYNLVRLYGVDCNQVANVAAAAKTKGMKLFLGVYNVAGGAYKSDLASMASQLNNDWSNVHTVSIGNELVNAGLQPSVIISALQDVKTNILNGKGPKVVTVDTFTAVLANPALCQNSDYTAVNMHPFFDPLTTSSTAGAFMEVQMALVRAACPSGQSLVITETGWPSAGEKVALAVPGVSQQATAVAQIKAAVGQGYIMLSAFNDFWKNPGPYDIENFFGLYGEAPSDNAMP
ncbi:hypothetical protein ANO11243_043150 [Dothideomycetidae sp. 11243]|nr:hypothetical protein ANO11243_043150 [fungal sp. No.11243]